MPQHGEPHDPRGVSAMTSERVSRSTLLLAGALDQLFLVGIFLLGFGTGYLVAELGEGSGASIGLGVGAGLVLPVACVIAEIRLAVTTGSTAGLFLLGLRFDPRQEVDWADDAASWLLEFWPNVLLLPLVRIVDRVTRRRQDERGLGFVRDPRARTGRARLARLLLALLLMASPVPLVLAVLR